MLLTAEDLAPVPGTPHAYLEADWKACLTRARERFAAHGGPPGGLLERLGWLRQERRGPGPEGGRPPSVVIRLNPRLAEVRG